MGKQRDHRERDARKILDEGVQARLNGVRLEACPYHSRAEMRELWIRGWEAADRSSGPTGDVQFYG